MNNKTLCLLLGLLSFTCAFGCEPSVQLKAGKERPSYTSYRSIPGVTEEEISAIEKFREANRTFIFGANPSTEFFTGEDGDIGGYSVLFCQWLTTLFGMQFKPAMYEWDDLLAGLESGAVDFTGEMTATEERRTKYFMTDAIAERTIKLMRLKDEDPLPAIEKHRPLRYAFLDDTTTNDQVSPFLKEGSEYVFVGNYDDAYRALKNGLVDAFFDESPAEAAFDNYDDVTAEDFLPLLYSPVSLTTQNPELEPIISIIQKALRSGGTYHLTRLYNQGYTEYQRHKFFSRLNAEEKEYLREYIASGRKIPVAMEYDNYPASFYNEQENQWQGLALDVLKEVEKLTGLTFARAHESRLEWPVLLGMLERGEAAMVTELIPSEERRGRFLWPDTPYQIDYYALLSRSDYPDIMPNEILYAKVGLIEESSYAAVFREWFPYHTNTVEYVNNFEAFDALERGEVDLLMMTQNQLLSVTNLLERPGFKANILFNRSYEASFGLNINERQLRSILSKVLPIMDTHSITQRWTHKLFDYRLKMAQATLPWLIGASILLLCVLLLVFTLFQRKRGEGKKMEVLVERRTAELRQTLTKLEAVTGNYKGIIWSVDKDGIITTFNGRYLETIGVTPSFLEGKKLELARAKNRHLDIIDHVEKTFRGDQQYWTGEVDGSMFQSYTTPIRDGKGDVIGVVGSTDDVTEMVKLQRDLEQAVEAAKAASQAKSDFLANMSHEIRTPMNAILGLTPLALETELNEKQHEYLHRIEVAAKALLRIINDILDFS
ncbi:MAG: transporter substrate-binding domain-containing protein, partial [Candidatus Adiutrix sp.]|nr:transporter substrate-binding domain-containing protein [Candidatus Adiutrix sp.]